MICNRKIALHAATVLVVAAVAGGGTSHMLARSAVATPLSSTSAENGIVLIGHALGGVEGTTYTNSREAFTQSMLAGRTVLEVDLQYTRDGIVAFHDEVLSRFMDSDARTDSLTTDEFLRHRVLGAYTPLSLEQLLELLQRHPNLTLITDTKRNTATMLATVVRIARRKDPALLERIVPQIYDLKELAQINVTHHFPRVVLTLYRTNATDEEVENFMKSEPQVVAVTMSESRFSSALAIAVREAGKDAFVHTINNPQRARQFIEHGANGVYTDFLTAGNFSAIGASHASQ